MPRLELKHIWNAPGYRTLTLTLVDAATRREYDVHVAPKDLQRLIDACADAAKQIGVEGPIDWETYPVKVDWPSITPWKSGPRRR